VANKEEKLITLALRRKAELKRIGGLGLLTREAETKTCECGTTFKTQLVNKDSCEACVQKELEEERRDEKLKVNREEYERQQRLIRDARFPLSMKDTSFTSSDPKIHPGEMAIAQTYASHFTAASRGLIIQSGALEVGTGKTWMAVCTGRMVVGKGKRVLFKTARDFLMELRQTYGTDVAEIDRLRSYLNVSLLILDDVGRDRPTEWVLNTYWSIFDTCMSNQVPVIVTTNKIVEAGPNVDCLEYRIGTGAYSRLLSICEHKVIHLDGPDLR